jgi:hypothetical protein
MFRENLRHESDTEGRKWFFSHLTFFVQFECRRCLLNFNKYRKRRRPKWIPTRILHMFCAILVLVGVRGLHTVLLSILSFMKAQGRQYFSNTHKGDWFCNSFAVYGVTNVVVKCLYYEYTLTTPFRLCNSNEQLYVLEPRSFLVKVLSDWWVFFCLVFGSILVEADKL